MSIQDASFRRLKDEAWDRDPAFLGALRGNDPSAKPQPLARGTGPLVLDDYSILVEKMPPGATPTTLIKELATRLNETVNDSGFNAINVFSRRASGSPRVGDIYDIDIPVDNGSVALAAIESDYFVFHTIETSRSGTHPECGSREFGFEHVGSGVRIYTRGASRAYTTAGRVAGRWPQTFGWTFLMRGISRTIESRGGVVRVSFTILRREEEYHSSVDNAPVFFDPPLMP